LPDQLSLADAVVAIQNSLPKCGQVRVVTIDGPAGSGKTTLAANLASKFEQASVIHLDELYEGWDKSLDQVLFERIQAWILKPLESGLPPKHLRYDWGKMAFTSWHEVAYSPVVIIEGVGSGHSSLRPYVSQAIWIEADEDLLLERVVTRDGESVRGEMLTWQAREKAYFELHAVKNCANLHCRGQS
jgi:uridine kinase